MNGTAEVVVVGGGIAGATIAFELARRGTAVRLLEQANIGFGASGRNTGTLLHQTEPPVAAMLRASLASYRELASGPVDFRLTERAQLLVARDARQWATIEAKSAAFAALGVNVEPLDGAALRAQLPALASGIVGGHALHGVYTVDAEPATRAYVEAARDAGAAIETGIRVGVLDARGGRVGGVVTDAGRVAADAVVLATGPWLTDLLPSAPLRPGRGWLMRTSRLPFALPWIVEEVSWPDQEALGVAGAPVPLGEVAVGAADQPVAEAFLFCPLPDGDALIGASLATSLRDAVEGQDAPRRMAARALELAPGLADRVGISRAWSALRPMTPDGLPLVGPSAVEGVFVHGGHASLGMQAAPATARWLAEHMHGERVDPTMSGLDPSRFVPDDPGGPQ